MKKVLVIAAHPDDELLGCGGAIISHKKNGDDVNILIMAEGATARNLKRLPGKDTNAEQLYEVAIKVTKLLEINKPIFGKLFDNRMDSYDFLDIVKKIEEVCSLIQPDIVYTHHGGDLNIDHQLTHRAVLTALRPTPDMNFAKILTFETLSSTEWSPKQQVSSFVPNYFVDITDYIEKKLQVLQLYQSEINEFPHPRSLNSIKALAQLRGSSVGLNAAEAFQLVLSIKR